MTRNTRTPSGHSHYYLGLTPPLKGDNTRTARTLSGHFHHHMLIKGNNPLFIKPFANTGLWTVLFLAVVAVLRFGHLLRGVEGAMLALGAQIFSLLVVLLLVRPERRKDTGFKGFKPRWWFISILGGFALGLLLASLNHFLLARWDWIVRMDKTIVPEAWHGLPFGLTEAAVALIGGVLTPLSEELFFRGLLVSVWRGKMNIWAVLVVQALIFGFLHLAHVGLEISPCFRFQTGLALNIFVATSLGGFLFGLARVGSGSLWPAVMAHAAVNLGAALIFVS